MYELIVEFNRVGIPKHKRVMPGGNLEGDMFIGPKAEEYRGLLKIKYPIEHGVVTNWNQMEKIWNYIFTEELKTSSEEVSFFIKIKFNSIQFNEINSIQNFMIAPYFVN